MTAIEQTSSDQGTEADRPQGEAIGRPALADRLSRLAHAKVKEAIRRYGNEISPTHDEALRQLVCDLSAQGLNIRPGRYAYALPCGAGKTQSVVAWIAAVHEMGLGLTVAVSAFQIEALFGIKRDLMSAGVPEDKIGLKHSLGPTAKLPDTGDDDRPIMLLSHARIRAAREYPVFCEHKGRRRDLLIWDESLMIADTDVLSLLDVEASIQRIVNESPSGSALAAALAEAQATINAEIELQEAGSEPKAVMLIDAIRWDAAREEAEHLRAVGGLHRQAAVKTVKSLLRLAARPVAIALTGSGRSGDGLIRYTIAVDPELTNIAILDASHPIRKLAHADGIIDGTTEAMRACKTVGADAILSHRAEPILSQGWKPTLRSSAVDKCRSLPGSLISLVVV